MRPKVLVIDDDDVVLDLVTDALGTDFEIVYAATADGAIRAAAKWEFAVVCCDYTLPESNGAEVLDVIASHNPDARCFLLTGDALEAAKASRAAFAVVTKPFRPSQLAELVGALSRHEFVKARRIVEKWGDGSRRPTPTY